MRAALKFLLLASFIGFAQAANNSAFVSQNVPAAMVPGQVYAVSVTMQNTGTTTWTPGSFHRLGTQNPQDNTLWIGTTRVMLPAGTSVAPGASHTFNFSVTAPSTPGIHNFQWKMLQEGVEWFGAQSVNVAVKVGLNDAAFVSQNVPAVMVPGQVYPVSVTMQNTGGTTWTPGSFHRLGTQNPQDNTLWTGSTRVMLPAGTSVAPGASHTFNFNVTAPNTPGIHNFQWKMVREGVEWFGAQSVNAAVKVGLNDAVFVAQNVPPVMEPGQTYPVTVTMSNTGGSTWSVSGYRLGSQNPQDNMNWGVNRVAPSSATPPGSNAIFSFNVTAPSTPGTYNFQWKMGQSGVEWFGGLSTNFPVRVGLDNAAFVSQSVPAAMIAGENYAVSVTMQNTGSTTWPAGTVSLGSQNVQDNMTWGLNRIALTTPVAPGATHTFNFNVTAPSSPGSYNFQWKVLEGPSYWFGAQSTNVAVQVATSSQDANLFFIHADHLNTPRLVANQSGQTVWRWGQQEPFGNNPADENPSGLGNFDLPLRLPGQYFDNETNVHYNYFRNYDPSIGRYEESDPIGLRAGLNTYAYVLGNPLSYLDPFGLDVKVCYYYEAAGGFGHIGFGAGTETGTQGYYPTGNPFRSPGIVQDDTQKAKECKVIPATPDQDNCMLDCRARRKNDPGTYVLNNNQCTSFVRECLKICGLPAGNYSGSAPRPQFLGLPGKSQ